MLTIYIGPNGYGKTTKLHQIKDGLVNNGTLENGILFLDSEISLEEEVKDTKDNTQTMEYIITELLADNDVQDAKATYEAAVDRVISSNQDNIDSILTTILNYNQQTKDPNKHFLNVSSKKAYKYMATIDSSEYVKKIGSGQRMQFLLQLAKQSRKNYIFIDEPERYSHPSLLNLTAALISDLSQNKEVYIATHSPKLVSMLDIDLENLLIINDDSHNEKKIDFSGITQRLTASIHPEQFPENKTGSANYYDETKLKNIIKHKIYREFIEALFSKDIYLCEGLNDEFFIKKALLDNNKYYTDYCIFKTFGKYHMPVFIEIFNSLGFNVHVYYDIDNGEPINDEITSRCPDTNYGFDKNLEEEFAALANIERINKNDFFKFFQALDSITIPIEYIV
jgi:predicted ATP-dependent endonuclease of OLD family